MKVESRKTWEMNLNYYDGSRGKYPVRDVINIWKDHGCRVASIRLSDARHEPRT